MVNKVIVKVNFILNLTDCDISYNIYLENIKRNSLSVQTKPIFTKGTFDNICSDSKYYKILLTVDGVIEGFIIATENIEGYPESHYSLEYFNKNYYSVGKRVIFFIGDNGGINISNKLLNHIKNNSDVLAELLNNVFKEISNIIEKPLNIIWNQSEHANRMILLREPFMDLIKIIKKQTPVLLMDKETFVHIHWMDNIFRKSRIIWTLKLAGYFEKNNNNGTNSKRLYTTKYILGRRYYIDHYKVMDDDIANEFYNIYHDRLKAINEKSPQKLEYSKKDFMEYLTTSAIDKYTLRDKNNTIVGGGLLIGKDNSNIAHWVTKEWRIADAYIKLIFVNKNEAKYSYLLLFAIAAYHILNRQGTLDNSRLLADWSDAINGRRFNQALSISQVPYLPRLLSSTNKIQPDKLLARIMIKLANFHATLLDNDMYYQITIE